MENINRNAR